jgi:hypothetical protein
LLNKAVSADEKKYYLIAQRYYLQAIEYIIPAIQFEKDSAKKQEIREKAHIYLKRAEEIATLIKPARPPSGTVSPNECTNKDDKKQQVSTSQRQDRTPRDESFSHLGISNIQPLAAVPNNTSDLTMVSSLDVLQTNNRHQNLCKKLFK